MAAPGGDPGPGARDGWLAFCAVIAVTSFVDLVLITGCANRLRRASKAEPVGPIAKPLRVPLFVRQLIFWLISGTAFNLIVWKLSGLAAAGNWLYGYVIEYMLSIDNLFVFQVVFRSYSTPSTHVDRALFWGIAIAVGLRIVFYSVGTELLGLGFAARAVFGLALVYSGIKTLRSDDEEDSDPRNNVLVRNVARVLPLHDSYCDEPCFFTRVPTMSPVAETAMAEIPPSTIGAPEDLRRAAAGGDGFDDDAGAPPQSNGAGPADGDATAGRRESGGRIADTDTIDGDAQKSESRRKFATAGGSLKVTPLFLVVLTIGIIDLVFAVDSVTAKISSVNGFSLDMNMFLNVTSSAFAMFVLRSLYAILDMLARAFRFLSFGVGIVLIFIGVKLMLQGYIEMGMVSSSVVIIGLLLCSILASLVFPEERDKDEEAAGDL